LNNRHRSRFASREVVAVILRQPGTGRVVAQGFSLRHDALEVRPIDRLEELGAILKTRHQVQAGNFERDSSQHATAIGLPAGTSSNEAPAGARTPKLLPNREPESPCWTMA